MNNYHIYEEVGRGKYSVVYKGRKKKTIEYVAVKSVERSRRKKLMNEVKIFHNLSHRNILQFYNWYETRNHLWIIFEYCSGGDLFQLLDTDKKLPEPSVKKFGYELIEGLSYLHSQGVIYADLKPKNVLLNEYCNLKLCDFGLSKKINELVV
jgi:serine/threonine-protein kinase ULK4